MLILKYETVNPREYEHECVECVYAKFRWAALRTKKALGIFRELITTTTTTTTTTRVALWDPPSWSKNLPVKS